MSSDSGGFCSLFWGKIFFNDRFYKKSGGKKNKQNKQQFKYMLIYIESWSEMSPSLLTVSCFVLFFLFGCYFVAVGVFLLTPTSRKRLRRFCCCSNSWMVASWRRPQSSCFGFFATRPAGLAATGETGHIFRVHHASSGLIMSEYCRLRPAVNSPRRVDRVLFWDTDSHDALRDILARYI